jgi:hypothetical protein
VDLSASLSPPASRRLDRLDRICRHLHDGKDPGRPRQFDQSTIELPGGHYLGASLRLYDPATASWSIRWLDSRRPGQITPPVVGGFANGIGIFYGDDRFGDRPIRVRFIWSRITRGAARWEQAFSLDEGNNWETNWFMDFTRREAP